MCVVAVFYHVLGVVLGSGRQIYKFSVKDGGGETRYQTAGGLSVHGTHLSAINPKRFLAAYSNVQYCYSLSSKLCSPPKMSASQVK